MASLPKSARRLAVPLGLALVAIAAFAPAWIEGGGAAARHRTAPATQEAGGPQEPAANQEPAAVQEPSARQEPAGETPGRSEAEIDHLTAEIAAQLRCLVCRGQSVLESNATLSREMQALIRERLVAGDTPDEVIEFFVARYGEYILLRPEARGLGLLVYVLPALGFLLGGLVVWRLLKRWSAASARGGPPGSARTAETAERAHPAEGVTAASAETPASAGAGAAVPAEAAEDVPGAPERSPVDATPGDAAPDAGQAWSDEDEAWLERAISDG